MGPHRHTTVVRDAGCLVNIRDAGDVVEIGEHMELTIVTDEVVSLVAVRDGEEDAPVRE
jgi:hypothetical protein